MKYPVRYPFRDRNGIERNRGDIMEIHDTARAASLQKRGLIGNALKEPEKPTPAPEVMEPEVPEPALEEEPEAKEAVSRPKAKGKKTAGKAKGGVVDEPA